MVPGWPVAGATMNGNVERRKSKLRGRNRTRIVGRESPKRILKVVDTLGCRTHARLQICGAEHALAQLFS